MSCLVNNMQIAIPVPSTLRQPSQTWGQGKCASTRKKHQRTTEIAKEVGRVDGWGLSWLRVGWDFHWGGMSVGQGPSTSCPEPPEQHHGWQRPSDQQLQPHRVLGVCPTLLWPRFCKSASNPPWSVRLPLRDMTGSPRFTALTQPTRLPAGFAGKNMKSMDWLAPSPEPVATERIFVPALTGAACSARYHPMTSLCISPGLSLSWAGLWAVLSMAVSPSTGSPSPWSTPVSSTSHFHCSEVQEPKSLESQYRFKISGSTAPHPIRQLASPGVAAFQEIGLCVWGVVSSWMNDYMVF